MMKKKTTPFLLGLVVLCPKCQSALVNLGDGTAVHCSTPVYDPQCEFVGKRYKVPVIELEEVAS